MSRGTKRGQVTNLDKLSFLARPSSGWFRGGEGFRDWLLERLEKTPSKADRKVRASEQARDDRVARAEKLIVIGLECFGLDEEELKEAKGGDARRRRMAEAIWKQTTVGQEWIAQRLGMRTAGNVSQQLRRGLNRAKEELSKRQLRKWEKLSRFVT